MEAAARTFFTSKYFAVAGASQAPNKYGYKVLAWYHAHSLPVTPMTPSRSSITISSPSPTTEYTTIPSPSHLPNPTQTSLSIITPPAVTREILREAKDVGVPAVWLQPGTYDDEVLEYAKKEFPAGAVGGVDSGVGGEGWCVLVDGDACLRDVGRAERL